MAQKKIRIEDLSEKMIIKEDVYTDSGVIIVPANTEVTEDVISLLVRHFIEEVVVEEGDSKQFAIKAREEKLKKEREKKVEGFRESIQIVEENLSQSLRGIAYQDKDIDVNSLLGMINGIIEKSDNDIDLCDMLFRMKQVGENLYSHSINVALYAQVLAKWAGFTEEEIELAGMAGILHDIGMLQFHEENVEKFTFRDEYEKNGYDKHVVYGYEMIKDKSVDRRVKQAVLDHHERLDRTGFPIAKGATGINRISRVIAVADAYDTLTMEEPGKDDITPFGALKYLENSKERFDPKLLLTFVERMAEDFINYEVLLSNGKKGKIVLINKLDLTRPLVQVGSTFIDLAVRTDLTIIKMYEQGHWL